MDHIKHATLHLTLLFILVAVNIEAVQLFQRPEKSLHDATSPSYDDHPATTYNSVNKDYSDVNYTEDGTGSDFENETETNTGKGYELNKTDSYPYYTSTASYSPTPTFPWSRTSTSMGHPTRPYSGYPYNPHPTRYPYTTSTPRNTYTTSAYPYWRHNTTTTAAYPYWRTTPYYGHRYPYTTTARYPYMPPPYYPHYQYNATTTAKPNSSASTVTHNTFQSPIYKICVKCRFFFTGGKINDTDSDDASGETINNDHMIKFNSITIL